MGPVQVLDLPPSGFVILDHVTYCPLSFLISRKRDIVRLTLQYLERTK